MRQAPENVYWRVFVACNRRTLIITISNHSFPPLILPIPTSHLAAVPVVDCYTAPYPNCFDFDQFGVSHFWFNPDFRACLMYHFVILNNLFKQL